MKKVEENNDLIPTIINGVSSPQANIRYNCAKVLMDLSEKLYQYMDFFIELLDSKYRILTWNTIITIANLTKVDDHKKFDFYFNKYFSTLYNDYMGTVANVVGNSYKIAFSKPYLSDKIVYELLKVKNLSTTLHLKEEYKRVNAEKTIKSFDMVYNQIKDKERVLSSAKKYIKSSRKTLKD